MYIFNQKDHSIKQEEKLYCHTLLLTIISPGWFIGTILKFLKQKGINYMNSRISIIGGNGFLGSKLKGI